VLAMIVTKKKIYMRRYEIVLSSWNIILKPKYYYSCDRGNSFSRIAKVQTQKQIYYHSKNV
jgi:hypothetical protein